MPTDVRRVCPTGVLRDSHENPYFRRSVRQVHVRRDLNMRCLKAALDLLRRAGISSVQDNTWFHRTVRNLNRLYRSGMLTCRFSCFRYGARPSFSWLMGLQRYRRNWFHPGPRKYFVDGAFSSRSAWLTEPYEDDGLNAGAGRPSSELERIVRKCVRRRRVTPRGARTRRAWRTKSGR